MPHDGQRLGVFLGQEPQPDFAVAGQLVVEADNCLVHLGRHGGLGQAGADFRCDFAGGERFLVLLNGSVGESVPSTCDRLNPIQKESYGEGRRRYKGPPRKYPRSS